MWPSCCNWLCAGTTATVDENGSSWRQAYTNSGFSPYPTSPDHLCKACGGHFETVSRKHVCVDCKKNFCSRCSVQLEPRPRLCFTCQRFHGNLFSRAELMRLKVKDLRDYLHLHEVPTQMCREKEELVELVIGQQTPPSSSSSDTVSQAGAPPDTDLPSNITVPPTTAINPATESETEQLTEDEDEDEEEEQGQEEEEEEDEDESSDSEDALGEGRRASLSDLRSVEDIEGLSVRQLKEILARNFVNFKGCCEKWELMERVTRLYNDQKDQQNVEPAGPEPPGLEENLCKICMDSPIDCVLLECGHMVTCSKCGKRMSECPICRQYVVRAVHVFRS
ncbi:E3 ubiquitin-protein ligase rififylin-like [Denticeps clupeoides]|uniref:RING-type E3 ubiquitin transferase n=1 Tax=Denticeps clupeoides TaxID=299321 RepID=A0AAY4EDV3_9TELE|nr:E3 ubiquitin-protein ligase rififylin-like [Denticeps clupeoides]